MKSYEELSGAEGRRVFYRAERFEARDLFPRIRPRLSIEGTHFELENISMSGLAARARLPEGAPDNLGDTLAVRLDGEAGPLFEGRGSLRRIETNGLDTRIALSFSGGYLDVSTLVTRYNEMLLKRELNGGLSHILEFVPPDYRRHCVDVLHLLRGYRSTLARFESTAVHEGEQPDRERLEKLFSMAEDRLLPEWRTHWYAANELVRPIMRETAILPAAKTFTENVLTPEFMGGPIWNRSYRKPLGYPGDYLMMNYVYEWRPRGATVFERLLHRIGLEVAECIATRMVMVQHNIARVIAAKANAAAPARILSLGCGPAQEVMNYLEAPRPSAPFEITLVDQDRDALGYAYERLYPKIVGLGDGSTVRCLQVSFVELMKANGSFLSLAPQDLIYSVGLIDYLSMKRVKNLLRSLYDKLAPGGLLAIANMADVPTGNQWPMEFICDWSLHYRSEAEMREIASAVPDAAVEIDPDPTGRVYMLYLRKP